MASKLSPDILALPKVELHVHIEGTITPAKCSEMAARNNVVLADGLFTPDGHDYQYSDFVDSITRVYFGLSAALKTGADYEDITYDYLKRCAAENTVYVELIACPGQAARSNIPYKDMIDGMAAGIDRARADFGIESRMNTTFERAPWIDDPAVIAVNAERDADMILSYKHPYIVGLDIAGGEKEGDIPPFRTSYERMLSEFGRPLGIRMHASESASADNAREAVTFGVTRLGHGINVINDADAVAMLRDLKVMFEVCVTSNVLAFKDKGLTYGNHPLRRMYDAGLQICLNTDDPGLFKTTIANEYQIAQDIYGFTLEELLDISANAVRYSFAPDEIKVQLLQKIESFRDRFFNHPWSKVPGYLAVNTPKPF